MFRMSTLRNVAWTLPALLALAMPVWAELVNGEELIDPTAPFLLELQSDAPAVNLFATLGSYEVSSILIRENVRIAVINSRRVREGEFIGNAQVVRIDSASVTLSIGGETRVLELHGAPIKTRAGG